MRLLFPILASLAIAGCSDPEAEHAADADGNGSMNATTAAPAGTGGPKTIDCDRARGQAEQAVCADKELTAIDRGMGEMPGYAADAAWDAKRAECSRSDDLRHCLLEAYGARIHDLASAKPADGGMVVGPVAFRCGADDVAATFINSDPGAVHLRAGTETVTLPRVAAASGVKYEGRPDGQPWSFWNKGREATLARGGSDEISCKELGRIDE